MANDGVGALARIGRTQHGLVTRRQAEGAGLASATLQRWVDGNRLEPVHSGVYRLAGAPRTWEQAVLAAVLAAGPGAAASHRTAGVLWGLLDDDDSVEVSVPWPRNSIIPGVTVHRSRDLAPEWVARRRAIA